MVNTHLHHYIDEEIIRLYQIESILKWIEFNSDNIDLIILNGDFNCLPDSLTYKLIVNSGFTSSFKFFSLKEPEETFHNKMIAEFKDNDPCGTYDYIFFKNNKEEKIKNISCCLLGKDEYFKGVYASDHYLLLSEFEFI